MTYLPKTVNELCEQVDRELKGDALGRIARLQELVSAEIEKAENDKPHCGE